MRAANVAPVATCLRRAGDAPQEPIRRRYRAWLALAPHLPMRVFALPAASSARPRREDVLALLRADRWAEADAAGRPYPDPVARKLVAVLPPADPRRRPAPARSPPSWRRTRTGPARPRSPAAATRRWPPTGRHDGSRADAAPTSPRRAPPPCCAAPTPIKAGHERRRHAAARQAWVERDRPMPPAETRSCSTGAALTGRPTNGSGSTVWPGPTPAAADPPGVAPRRRRPARRAEARLALRRDDRHGARALLARPAAAHATIPALFLDQARWLRRAGQDEAALALVASDGGSGRRTRAPPDHLTAFWDERNLLARAPAAQGDAAGAYALAAGAGSTAAEQVADAEFLAGFIALRRLNDPATGRPPFRRTGRSSKAAITQARGALLARPRRRGTPRQDAAARRIRRGRRLADHLLRPARRAGPRRRPGRAERPHPAVPRPAIGPIQQRCGTSPAASSPAPPRCSSPGASRTAPAPSCCGSTSWLPTPPTARLAARSRSASACPIPRSPSPAAPAATGVMLPDTGWPLAADPPRGPVDPALALGVIRQESSFDTDATQPGRRARADAVDAGHGAERSRDKLGAAGHRLAALTTDPGLQHAARHRLSAAAARPVRRRVPLAVAGLQRRPGPVQNGSPTNGDPRAAGRST